MKKAQKHGLHGKNRKPHGRKPHSKAARGFAVAAISLLSIMSVLMIGFGIYFWRMFGLMNFTPDNSDAFVDSMIPDDFSEDDLISDYTEIEEGAASVAEISVKGNTKSIANYLLIGIDARSATSLKGLADSVMILTIDKKSKSIKLTSILRDTLVTIPGRDRNNDGKDDYAKFNASYSYGGFNLLSKTIEQNFRLKIEKYITINFAAFKDAVDILGGVDIPLTAREASHIKVGSVAKTYSLNGHYALEYARIRKLDSDFGRTNRQRKVMGALFKKAKGMSIGDLNNLLNKTLPRVDTNMTPNEFTVHIFNSMTYFNYGMDKSYHLPPDGGYKPGGEYGIGSVLVLKDPAGTVTELHKFIYN